MYWFPPFYWNFVANMGLIWHFLPKTDVFLGRFVGRQSGNVLLRRAQYRQSEQNPIPIARNIIAAKIQASKRLLQRQIRNHGENPDIQAAIAALNSSLQQLKHAQNTDTIRGIEGDAAARYFGVFGQMLSEKAVSPFKAETAAHHETKSMPYSHFYTA